jgi:predicted nucleic acid-binding protein
MIVVVDTNVLLSGLLSAHGTPARVLDLLTMGDLQVAYDDRIATEYRQVLARPRFGFHLVAPPLPATLPNPDDQPFWEVAVEAAAPLITGNLKHFPTDVCIGIEVLTPTTSIERWRSSHS